MKSLHCVKGGGTACRDGGIVKKQNVSQNNPSAAFGVSSLYTREPLVRAPRKSICFFLTSTAFVVTKAKPRAGGMRGYSLNSCSISFRCSLVYS